MALLLRQVQLQLLNATFVADETGVGIKYLRSTPCFNKVDSRMRLGIEVVE